MPSLSRVKVPAGTDDATLIERAQAGDESAFSALYKRHARNVAGAVYRMLGNDDQLDDIVQDTFVIALRRLHALKEPAALRRWLITIAIRRAQRVLAKRYRQRALSDALERTQPRVSQPQVREQIHGLYRNLERLPAKHRVPWVLHHIEGHTLAVVAQMCGTSLATVKRNIAAANDRLWRLNNG